MCDRIVRGQNLFPIPMQYLSIMILQETFHNLRLASSYTFSKYDSSSAMFNRMLRQSSMRTMTEFIYRLSSIMAQFAEYQTPAAHLSFLNHRDPTENFSAIFVFSDFGIIAATDELNSFIINIHIP